MGGFSSLQSQGVRYMFLEWEHNFIFCAPSKLIILPQLVVLRPRFFPDRCTTVFFRVFAHNIFTPDARCAVVFIVAFFWLWVAATPQLALLRGLAVLYANLFSPSAGRPFFSWRFALLFFPGVARPFFRKDSCSRHNPVYPASKLAALRTLIFTRLLCGRFLG